MVAAVAAAVEFLVDLVVTVVLVVVVILMVMMEIHLIQVNQELMVSVEAAVLPDMVLMGMV